MKAHRNLFWFLMVVLTPSVAFANVGTALMWASGLHMLFGNILLGLLEGLFLAKFFKVSKKPAIGFMILANYFSAWLGMEFFVDYLSQSIELTIENVGHWLRVFMWAAFGITLLAEFPFIWLSLRNQKRAFLTALKATGILHCLSYALLFWWYSSATVTSMMTELEVVSASELVPEEKYVLHYLSQDGNTVQRMNLDGKSEAELYSEVSAPDDNDRLFVRSMEGGRFDLYLHQDLGNRKSREVEIRKGFAHLATVDPRMKRGRTEFTEGSDFNFGGVASLAKDSGWKYFVGFWPSSGIEGSEKEGDGGFWYALETPIAAWLVRNAVHLEGNYLVFQLGKDQICILHHESKKIALLVRGKGPVVATPKN